MNKRNTVNIILITTIFFAVHTKHSTAQNLSGAVDVGIPINKSDNTGLGIGATARYEGPWGTHTSAMLDAGVISFAGKTVGATSYPSWTVIPIQAGVKFYFDELFSGLYISGQMGIHFISVASESQQDFGFAPGIGYHFNKADVGIRFQSILGANNESYNFIGIRGAYIFSEKKNYQKRRR